VLHNQIKGASSLSKAPKPLLGNNNQEPELPASSSNSGSIIQEVPIPPEIVLVRGKLIPRYPKLTRITGELPNSRALLVINQNTKASKILILINKAFTGPNTHL
jgi:hypothetical protein